MPLPFALQKNIPMQVKFGHGSGCFLKLADGVIKKQASKGATISILRLFSVLCMKLLIYSANNKEERCDFLIRHNLDRKA
ncbi:hypothetical protein [Treponema sp. Marseille-Q4523]|uniref:hypothetical protein n=1 Tax=Treponema sp. Marseille-Q4523 TaxID=2810610 RepID=UPI001EF4C182|nr:hypothetical protein [Treponema sp. Marseille-Q4523]